MAKRAVRGEGSVFRDNRGYWSAQITGPDGKRKTKRSKIQREVRDWLQSQRQAIHNNSWVSDDKLTVGAYMDRYMVDVVKPSVRPRTFESYQSWYTHHIKPGLGSIRLVKLSPQQVQAFYTEQGGVVSSRSVQYMHAILHKALEQAVRWSLVPRNVTDLVTPPSVKHPQPVVWSMDELKQFMAVAKEHRLYALWAIAISCGMREGELLGIQVSDIQWDTGTINVNHALQLVRGQGLVLTTPKTAKSRRTIKVPASALQILRDHVEQLKENQRYVFAGRTGEPMLPRTLVETFKVLIKRSGVPDIRFHDLRHLCATIHLQAGTNPAVVAALLGHSTVNLTLSTYSHVLPSIQDEAADRMDRLGLV
jgi:integrase